MADALDSIRSGAPMRSVRRSGHTALPRHTSGPSDPRGEPGPSSREDQPSSRGHRPQRLDPCEAVALAIPDRPTDLHPSGTLSESSTPHVLEGGNGEPGQLGDLGCGEQPVSGDCVGHGGSLRGHSEGPARGVRRGLMGLGHRSNAPADAGALGWTGGARVPRLPLYLLRTVLRALTVGRFGKVLAKLPRPCSSGRAGRGRSTLYLLRTIWRAGSMHGSGEDLVKSSGLPLQQPRPQHGERRVPLDPSRASGVDG